MDSRTSFEQVVASLHLSPEEYEHSTLLKEWVLKHKDDKYVPPRLLEAWGLAVDDAA